MAADSCCVCGLVLATHDSDFPRWCKEIRGLCLFNEQPILSGTGHMDNDAWSFNLPIPLHGFRRFCYRRSPSEFENTQEYCYPIHASCWYLLQESNGGSVLENEVDALFNIFESFHYNRNDRALRWGQGYYFEDIIDSYSSAGARDPWKGIIAAHKGDMPMLADPLRFDLDETPKLRMMSSDRLMVDRKGMVPTFEVMKMDLGLLAFLGCGISIVYSMKIWRLPRRVSAPAIVLAVIGTICGYRRNFYLLSSRRSTSRLLSLPSEIFELILFGLDFDDVQRLLKSSAVFYRKYGRGCVNLPRLFWESRFWAQGEAAFARASRPSTHSWREWFFTIKSELRAGSNRMNLRNRKRIWKLGAELTTIAHNITGPGRVLRGNIVTLLPNQIQGPTASCLALKYDSEGCRELKQIYASFENIGSGSRPCALAQSYVLISNRKVLSGVTFSFNDGHCVDAGYVGGEDRDRTDIQLSAVSPKFLWVVFSPSGFVAITFNTCSQAFLDTCMSSHGRRLAVARWPWDCVKGIYLGLDAMRIVRITIDSPKAPTLDDLAWTPPSPLSVPSINEDELIPLHKLQSESFSPASTICIEPPKGQLTIINVYSPLGWQAGITGIRFVYDTGLESVWGTTDDAASLAFFMDEAEQLVKVKVYRLGSSVAYLQFFTNLHRTSHLFPQPHLRSNESMECIEHVASHNGYIVGFCGCFFESSKQLNGFGVLATCSIASKLSWSIPEINVSCALQDGFLGGVRNHGIQRSHRVLLNRYHSVQASINTEASKYRCIGQVTGLVLLSVDHDRHPDLLGQWTGTGKTYDLKADEQILDLEVTTVKSRFMRRVRPGASQVESITIVTNLRRIRWGPSTALLCDRQDRGLQQRKDRITEVFWDFNAIFDRVQCIYE